MPIGIDASRAFLKNRTGIEQYSYQVIKNLRNSFLGEKVFLYVRKTDNLQLTTNNGNTKINELELPVNWQVRIIGWPRFWTQIGLSLEMLLRPVDVLFVPAHTVSFIHPARNATQMFNNPLVWYIRKFFNSKEDWEYAHSVAGGPKNTIVTIHGLEYEFCRQAYSFWERIYMRVSIKNSCRWASKIIAVSNNTKKDLVNLYNIPEEKIEVIHEGCNFEFRISNFESNPNDSMFETFKIQSLEIHSKFKIQNSKFILFIGRIEERKNISNIIKAFEILKEKYQIPHNLILAGKPGHGHRAISYQLSASRFKDDILELGFVSEEKKWELLKKADVFVFPTQYEGFGIPVLEAQSVDCPVLASSNSSIPEIVGESAILVDPDNVESMAKAIFELVSNESLKDDIIAKGLENVKRFSWEKCAKEISEILMK